MLTTNLTATSPTINISSSTGSLAPVDIASNLKLLDLVGGVTQSPDGKRSNNRTDSNFAQNLAYRGQKPDSTTPVVQEPTCNIAGDKDLVCNVVYFNGCVEPKKDAITISKDNCDYLEDFCQN